jgi:hypothetical protein
MVTWQWLLRELLQLLLASKDYSLRAAVSRLKLETFLEDQLIFPCHHYHHYAIVGVLNHP